jgi:hypothetical protein
MAGGSKRYTDLIGRLGDLRQNLLHFLPAPPLSKTSYTPQELDLTRSYVLLAHAEIEAFCEDLATAKAQAAKRAFVVHGKISPSLRRMIMYYVAKEKKSWSEVANPSPQTVDSASQSHLDGIENNNGVKRQNIEKLFYPVGMTEPHFDATWLAQMDSFGRSRGDWAHRSIRLLNLPDPASEVANVEKLLVGLLDLDRKMSRRR